MFYVERCIRLLLILVYAVLSIVRILVETILELACLGFDKLLTRMTMREIHKQMKNDTQRRTNNE